jgi:cytochrome c553
MTSSPATRPRLRPGIQCIGRGLLVAALSISAHAADRVPLCESCHGSGGNSTTPLIPSIAGQPVTFLENQLIFFREELRNAPVMVPLMKGVKDEEVTALARHFSGQPLKAQAPKPADAASARGKELAGKMHCGQCHLPDYRGRNQMPRLAGQREDYVVDAMIGYRDGKRTGADTTMSEVLYGMGDADIKALAAFLATLPP